MKLLMQLRALFLATALLAGCGGGPVDTSENKTPPDTTPPTITTMTPDNGETGVSTTASIRVTFSEPVDPTTVNNSTFRVTGPGGLVSGSYSAEDNDAVFNPVGELESEVTYLVKLTTGIKDLAGNALSTEADWQFTIRDAVAPAIVSVSPADRTLDVTTDEEVVVTFNEPIDIASVNATTFEVSSPSGPVTGTYAAVGNDVVFTPTDGLTEFETPYTVTISGLVKDLSGNAFGQEFKSTFWTLRFVIGRGYRLRKLRDGKYLDLNEFDNCAMDDPKDVPTQEWTLVQIDVDRFYLVSGAAGNPYLTGSTITGGVCYATTDSDPQLQTWRITKAQLGLHGYELTLPLGEGSKLVFQGPTMTMRVSIPRLAEDYVWNFEKF